MNAPSGSDHGHNEVRIGGRVVTVRPIEPTDAAALVRFHEGLSVDTTRLRFFTQHAHLTRREVIRFTEVDHHDREAVVMCALDEIVGVGRYERAPSRVEAEVAFVVSDAWQGRGAGPFLFSWLVGRAAQEGITRFVADVLGENHRMLEVFDRTGLVTTKSVECGVVHVTMELPPGTPARGTDRGG